MYRSQNKVAETLGRCPRPGHGGSDVPSPRTHTRSVSLRTVSFSIRSGLTR